MDTATFVHEEADVAERMGIDRALLKKTRSEGLERGVDWDVQDRRVRYSPDGLKKAAAVLGIPTMDQAEIVAGRGACEATDEKNGDGTVQVRFVRGYRSVHLCQGELDGRPVTVRLRDWKKLRLGMVMPCRKVSDGFFELARPCPRYQGRW